LLVLASCGREVGRSAVVVVDAVITPGGRSESDFECWWLTCGGGDSGNDVPDPDENDAAETTTTLNPSVRECLGKYEKDRAD
jgi:hypothetical protein